MSRANGRPLGGGLTSLVPDGARMGMARNYRAIRGRLVADVMFPETGEALFGVPVKESGGTATRFAHTARQKSPTAPAAAPNADSVSVVVEFVSGGVSNQLQPIITGEMASSTGTLVDSIGDPTPVDDARNPTVTVEDHALVNAGAAMIVTAEGEVVADTTGSGRPIKLQVGADGYIRMSQDGNASGRVVLAAEFVTLWNGLMDKLTTIEARLIVVEESVPIVPIPDVIEFPHVTAEEVQATVLHLSSEVGV